jgi:hypothetical protein
LVPPQVPSGLTVPEGVLAREVELDAGLELVEEVVEEVVEAGFDEVDDTVEEVDEAALLEDDDDDDGS